MKIYTRTGDSGETGLWGGERVSKSHPRLEAYGTIDELLSSLGVVLANRGTPKALGQTLKTIQNELLHIGSELATPPQAKFAGHLIGKSEVERLEQEIDAMESKLKPLKNFILPGGSPVAAAIHVSRTVCRRAERAVVALSGQDVVRGEVLSYLNRLADHLFVCARFANRLAKIKDAIWIGRSL